MPINVWKPAKLKLDRRQSRTNPAFTTFAQNTKGPPPPAFAA
jgi:hypothetical protein